MNCHWQFMQAAASLSYFGIKKGHTLLTCISFSSVILYQNNSCPSYYSFYSSVRSVYPEHPVHQMQPAFSHNLL